MFCFPPGNSRAVERWSARNNCGRIKPTTPRLGMFGMCSFRSTGILLQRVHSATGKTAFMILGHDFLIIGGRECLSNRVVFTAVAGREQKGSGKPSTKYLSHILRHCTSRALPPPPPRSPVTVLHQRSQRRKNDLQLTSYTCFATKADNGGADERQQRLSVRQANEAGDENGEPKRNQAKKAKPRPSASFGAAKTKEVTTDTADDDR